MERNKRTNRRRACNWHKNLNYIRKNLNIFILIFNFAKLSSEFINNLNL